MKAPSPNYWTTREVPWSVYFPFYKAERIPSLSNPSQPTKWLHNHAVSVHNQRTLNSVRNHNASQSANTINVSEWQRVKQWLLPRDIIEDTNETKSSFLNQGFKIRGEILKLSFLDWYYERNSKRAWTLMDLVALALYMVFLKACSSWYFPLKLTH